MCLQRPMTAAQATALVGGNGAAHTLELPNALRGPVPDWRGWVTSSLCVRALRRRAITVDRVDALCPTTTVRAPSDVLDNVGRRSRGPADLTIIAPRTDDRGIDTVVDALRRTLTADSAGLDLAVLAPGNDEGTCRLAGEFTAGGLLPSPRSRLTDWTRRLVRALAEEAQRRLLEVGSGPSPQGAVSELAEFPDLAAILRSPS